MMSALALEAVQEWLWGLGFALENVTEIRTAWDGLTVVHVVRDEHGLMVSDDRGGALTYDIHIPWRSE